MPSADPLRPPHASLIAARDTGVVCDLSSLSVLAVSGPDAATFLQGQLSSDVAGLAEGGARYTSLNSPKGRMLANFVVWREGPEVFHALVPGDLCDAVRKRLSMYVLRSKVALDDVSAATARFGVGGPAAADSMRAALGAFPGPLALARVHGTTAIGLPGPRYAVLVPAEAASEVAERLGRHAVRAPFSVWQWLTIRAGIPVVTALLQDQLVAQTANWDLLGGVDFDKGCYTGQEIIARMQYLGRLKERLFAFHADSEAAAAGTRIFAPALGDEPCGVVVNAAPAPDGGSDLLAVAQIAASEAGGLRLGAPDGPALSLLPLPYPVPPRKSPTGRVGAGN